MNGFKRGELYVLIGKSGGRSAIMDKISSSMGIPKELLAMDQRTHPELREGELFWSNSKKSLDQVKDTEFIRWSEFDLSSVRMGETAYDVHDRVVPNSKPFFVKKKTGRALEKYKVLNNLMKV